MENYSRSIDIEFSRLQNLGWKLWSKNVAGVRKLDDIDATRISFPSNAWDCSGENAEHTGYWAQHRAETISRLLKKYGVKLMWEVGAGSGNATFPVSERGTPVIGIEPLESGAANIAKLGCESFAGTFEQLEFPPLAIECVGMFDVLEHIYDTKATLRVISNTLASDGIFIATVPAHRWLFSDFDIVSGHYRRYSRKLLRNELESAGLTVLEISWLFGFLVLPALLLRRVPYLLGRKNIQRHPRSQTKLESKTFNRIFRAILRIESQVGLVTGLSIVVVAKKNV